MSPIRLLYVDDDADTCAIVTSFCERIGTFTIKTLDSGESALVWLAASTADVIVSGYHIHGGIDGMNLLRTLRARGDTTPFIFFSAIEEAAVRKEACHEGAFGFISKNATGKIPIYQLIRTIFWAVNNALPARTDRTVCGNTAPDTPDPGYLLRALQHARK